MIFRRSPFLIILAVLAGLSLSLTGLPYHKVVFVYDGDTVLLENGSRVRYVGINTPEIDHEGGKSEFMADVARDVNQTLVQGMQVRLEYDEEELDQYGRRLAYLFLANGDMVNALLVRQGLAHVMSIRPNLKYRDLLLDCQREAIDERVGIWSNLLRIKEICVGDRNAYRFHRPDCPFAKRIPEINRIEFGSRFRAFWEGYTPCRSCRP